MATMAATGDHEKILLAASTSRGFDIHLTLSSLRKLINGSVCDPYQIMPDEKPDDVDTTSITTTTQSDTSISNDSSAASWAEEEPEDSSSRTCEPTSSDWNPPSESESESETITFAAATRRQLEDAAFVADVSRVATPSCEQEGPRPKNHLPRTADTTTGDHETNNSSAAPEEQEDPTTTRRLLSGAHVSDTPSTPLQDETTTTRKRSALEEEKPTPDHRLARWMSPTKSPLVSTDQGAWYQENQEEHIQTASWDVPTELLFHLSTDVGLKLSFLAPEELREPAASAPLDDTAKRLGAVDGRNQLRSTDWPPGCHRLQDPHQLIKLHRNSRRIKLNNATKQKLPGFHQPN
jgi:hypothetical protein